MSRVSLQTTAAGAFSFGYRVPAGRRGASGDAAQRPATSPFAAFTAR